MSLRNGFTFGEWTVYPLEGRLVGVSAEERVQPKSMDVLLYMAEHAGAVVEREVLLQQVWEGRAQSDEPLTRCVGELRRALGDTRAEPDYILTIPKRGYRLLKPVAPLEIDDAISDEPRADDSAITPSAVQQPTTGFGTAAKIAVTVVVLLATALSAIYLERLHDEPASSVRSDEVSAVETATQGAREGVSVAVLPFAALSSGEDDGYFADGLTEEVLNALTQCQGLRVTARTSSFFFKGKNLPAAEIAAQLNVAHIVEGSVRRDGQRLRITAQLVRVSDDSHLWSAAYDRTLGDVFAVQQDIAENIAAVLGVVMDDDARAVMSRVGVRNVEAFIAYQKGLDAWVTAHSQFPGIAATLEAATMHLDQALEAVPELTSARMMKADRYIHILLETASGYRGEQHAGEAQAALDELLGEYGLAVQLAPAGNQRDIMEAERTLFGNDWSNVRMQIERALRPGRCPQLDWLKVFISHFGYAEQLIEKTGETLACNPKDIPANYNLPWLHIMAGDPGAALRAVEQAGNNGIHHPWLDDARFLARVAAGQVDGLAVDGPGPPGSTIRHDRRILVEALSGNADVARQMAEDYWSRPDADDVSSLIVAAIVGNRDRANEFAARIDQKPGSGIVFSEVLLICMCGAAFDLDAAPNYRDRVNQAGFAWPPPKPIDYPTKSW